MTQYCSQCFKPVTIPVGAIAPVPCPVCGAMVPPNEGYQASVAVGGGVPTSNLQEVESAVVPPGLAGPPPAPAPDPLGAGVTPPPGVRSSVEATAALGTVGVTISAAWLRWIPIGCITLAFLLMFLTWVEVKLGGYSVLSQSAWNTVGGSANTHNLPTGEDWKKLEKVLDGNDEPRRAARLRSDGLMVLYALLLFASLPLLYAQQFVKEVNAAKLPSALRWLPRVWQYLPLVLLGVLSVLLFLVVFQSFQRFGLQSALETVAKLNYDKELTESTSESEKRAVWIKIGQEQGKYPAETTIWVGVVVLLHFTAVLAMLGLAWLDVRGGKPAPRVAVNWS